MNKIKLVGGDSSFTPSTRSLFIDCNGRLVKKHVDAVYSGRHGCACGCRGTHRHHTESPRSITVIVKKILAQAEVQDIDWDNRTDGDPQWVSATTPTRHYIAYFAEEATK